MPFALGGWCQGCSQEYFLAALILEIFIFEQLFPSAHFGCFSPNKDHVFPCFRLFIYVLALSDQISQGTQWHLKRCHYVNQTYGMANLFLPTTVWWPQVTQTIDTNGMINVFSFISHNSLIVFSTDNLLQFTTVQHCCKWIFDFSSSASIVWMFGQLLKPEVASVATTLNSKCLQQ